MDAYITAILSSLSILMESEAKKMQKIAGSVYVGVYSVANTSDININGASYDSSLHALQDCLGGFCHYYHGSGVIISTK